MAFVPPARHLLRAKDLADARYSESIRSFTTTYGISPTRYRAKFPPAADRALVPACVVRAYGRPQHRTFGEDTREERA